VPLPPHVYSKDGKIPPETYSRETVSGLRGRGPLLKRSHLGQMPSVVLKMDVNELSLQQQSEGQGGLDHREFSPPHSPCV
jgi:hypothetical protein